MRWRAGSAVVAGAVLAACGGSGHLEVTGGTNGDDGFVARAAVVAADLDADGLADVSLVPRDGTSAARCWRNSGDGAFLRPPDAWSGAGALAALADDLDALDDATLASGTGARRVGGGGLPYVVLHVADGSAIGDAPAIDAVDPASGTSRDVVLVRGRGLASSGAATGVTFSGVAAAVLVALPDAVVAVVPDGLPEGRADVRVVVGASTSDPAAFVVRRRSAPIVESWLPSVATPGGVLWLRGEGLGGPTHEVEVTFANARAVRALGFSTAALVVVPEDARSGLAVVAVGGLSSAPFDVRVGAARVPRIVDVSPSSASVGSIVRIGGSDLLGAVDLPRVEFDGVAAALYSIEGDAIRAIVPPGAGDGDVVVRVGGRASDGVPFRAVTRGAPQIDSLSPATASVGEIVEVRGTDLADLSAWRPNRAPPSRPFGDLRVTLGGREAWFVLPLEGTLRFRVPDGATSGDVVVIVNGRASDPAALTIR